MTFLSGMGFLLLAAAMFAFRSSLADVIVWLSIIAVTCAGVFCAAVALFDDWRK